MDVVQDRTAMPKGPLAATPVTSLPATLRRRTNGDWLCRFAMPRRKAKPDAPPRVETAGRNCRPTRTTSPDSNQADHFGSGVLRRERSSAPRDAVDQKGLY